jgi:myo-inositol catabolism protein IolC
MTRRILALVPQAEVGIGYSRPLYLLAFDHRASFSRDLFRISGTPTPEQLAQIAEAKALIFDGFLEALANGAPDAAAGVLVDEHYGANVARSARERGVLLAMPVEASGQKQFSLEYGDEFAAHIKSFEPDLVKVLVRYNPAEGEANAEQVLRLASLSAWLHEHGRKFLFELLVPGTPRQLESVGGDADRYDLELRPDLLMQTIAELQDGGVEPDIWKIEGLDRAQDCKRAVAQARRGGRDGVACIVLGRGASQSKVANWLKVAAPVAGFFGFAVGRSIWFEPLAAYLDGTPGQDTAARIGAAYLELIHVYESAAPAAGG